MKTDLLLWTALLSLYLHLVSTVKLEILVETSDVEWFPERIDLKPFQLSRKSCFRIFFLLVKRISRQRMTEKRDQLTKEYNACWSILLFDLFPKVFLFAVCRWLIFRVAASWFRICGWCLKCKSQVVEEAFEQTACSCRIRVFPRVEHQANAGFGELLLQFINP